MSLLDSDSEESLVADSCKHAWMAWVSKAYVVRVVSERTVCHDLDVSDDVPSRERIIKLE